jgi:hypothetical protein
VWFDEWEIRPGDSIPAKIEEGLERSRVLVLCMSANAFGSDWAQLESGTFRFRDPLNKERRFLPLRLDDTPIKGSLPQFHCINWASADREQEYLKLLEACKNLVGTHCINPANSRAQYAPTQIVANTIKPAATEQPQQQINITSINQSGNAITAHTVNLGDPKIDFRVAALAAEADARAAKEKADAQERARNDASERPNTLFQRGKPVAKALAMTLDEAKGVAYFAEITNSVELNSSEPFEYRSFLLKMTHADEMIGMSIPGIEKGQIIRRATCVIVGRVK